MYSLEEISHSHTFWRSLAHSHYLEGDLKHTHTHTLREISLVSLNFTQRLLTDCFQCSCWNLLLQNNYLMNNVFISLCASGQKANHAFVYDRGTDRRGHLLYALFWRLTIILRTPGQEYHGGELHIHGISRRLVKAGEQFHMQIEGAKM